MKWVILKKTYHVATTLLSRCFLAIAFLLHACPVSQAQVVEWGLDLTFGNGGRIVTDFPHESEVQAVLLQSDGKVVVAGGAEGTSTGVDFALARYDTNGKLDASFGNGGKVTTDFFGLADEAFAIAIQPDGKIMLAGESEVSRLHSEFALARYNSNGTLDISFGKNGRVTTDFFDLPGSSISGAIFQPDGKVVVTGSADINSSTTRDFGIARYHHDGGLDTSFGNNGKVNIDFFGYDDSANELAIQPDGKIVVVGYASFNINSSSEAALARLNSDGSLDTSFGSNGKIVNRNGGGNAVALQADSKIVVPKGAHSERFGVTRYNIDGSLDSNFGTDEGETNPDLESFPTAIALQADGKIIVAGLFISAALQESFLLARYNSDGTIDSTFGKAGNLITDFGGGSARALAVTIQADGKIIVAGVAGSQFIDGRRSFALARYLKIISPDFALTIAPSNVSLTKGQTVKITVDINRFAGFIENVTVSVPVIDGIKVKVKPTSASTTEASLRFKLTIKGSPSSGFHYLTFLGRDATGRERSVPLTIFIP